MPIRDLCFHASSLPCSHTFWHAIPTSFYIFNVFSNIKRQTRIVTTVYPSPRWVGGSLCSPVPPPSLAIGTTGLNHLHRGSLHEQSTNHIFMTNSTCKEWSNRNRYGKLSVPFAAYLPFFALIIALERSTATAPSLVWGLTNC